MNRTSYVYILASRSRNLYTGVTNNIERRLIEHRQGAVPGFTKRYRIFRLVHLEVFGDIRDAIAREKEIKAWRREKRIWLIERENRLWEDLAHNLVNFKKNRGIGSPEKADPSHRSKQPSEPVRDDARSQGGVPPATRH